MIDNKLEIIEKSTKKILDMTPEEVSFYNLFFGHI